MAFSSVLPELPIARLIAPAARTRVAAVVARGEARSLDEFACLLSPAAEEHLETLLLRSRRITQANFGRTIRLFAPLYLSNECINICTYCGFSRNNPIPRVTIPAGQAEAEARKLASKGFRSLLIVAGEHPKYVSSGYVAEVIRRSLPHLPSIQLELGPLETEEYVPLVRSGAEGLVLYQETYHPEVYAEVHTAGPKKNYPWRLDGPERGYAAGFRRLGVGALYGLADWRYEAIALAAHVEYLQRHCWKAQISISFPRLRPAAGGFQPKPGAGPTDRQLAQLIAAFRLRFPTVGLVLSTREAPRLRDGLVSLGITTMSAGSSTEPGGYSSFDETAWAPAHEQEGEQFHIADERPPAAVAAMIRNQGYEPVWKDMEATLVSA